MKVFTYSEARQRLSDVLNIAQNEEVEIRRRDGQVFSIVSKKSIIDSPFDIKGIKTKVKGKDIFSAVRESRAD
ncbi:MAG: prevent-host-death protein [Thermodesulfobacteriota bacterium]|nr:prevent-host-death protein [Thermodesulfobacteriota bacterium]